MNIRTLLIAAGLATLAGGCTYTPDYDYGDRGYGPGYPVYRDTDAYGGYFYVQIIYIDGEPWYVDDYRRAHPIPPHLRSHFRNASWARSLPPRWGHDDDMRDGYRLSRIVYVNDAPVYVDDDRRARPLPAQVRSRFTYQEVVRSRDAGPNRGEPRPMPQPRYDNEPRPALPSSGGDVDRPQPPGYGRERTREMPPADGRGPEREVMPSPGRERERMAPPVSGPQTMPKPPMTQERVRQEQQIRQAPPTMTPERVRVTPPGRPVQPSMPDDRGAPQGRAMDQPSDRGAGRDRPPQQGGSKANERQRAGGADQKQDRKASGRDKDRGQDERERRGGTGDQSGD